MEALGKIRKGGRVALVVVWALQLVMLVGLVVSVVNAVRMGFLRAGAEVNPGFVLSGVLSMVVLAGFMVLLMPVGGLLLSLGRERTPFVHKNVKRLRCMALLLLVLAVVQFVGDLVSNAMTFTMMDLQTGTVVRASYNVFNLTTFMLLAFALVVWCLSLVFRYGAALQQQSDETL